MEHPSFVGAHHATHTTLSELTMSVPTSPIVVIVINTNAPYLKTHYVVPPAALTEQLMCDLRLVDGATIGETGDTGPEQDDICTVADCVQEQLKPFVCRDSRISLSEPVAHIFMMYYID